MKVSHKKKVFWIIILVAALAALFYGIYYKSGPVYAALNQFGLIPHAETYTDLYFQNPSSLPTSIQKGQKVSFAFTIGNEEGVSTAYPYVVYFENPAGTQSIMAQSEVSLGANASATIPVSYTFNNAIGTGTIVVDLIPLDQEIDFHVANATPNTAKITSR